MAKREDQRNRDEREGVGEVERERKNKLEKRVGGVSVFKNG